MIKVIAIDPGITTGFAYGKIDNNGMIVLADQAELKCLGLWRTICDIKPQYIVCETFEFRQGKQRSNLELYSRNLIGVIQLYHEMHKSELHMQTAAQGKAYFSNPRLKEIGCYIKAKEHARDAVRHLLYWYTFGAGYQYNKKGVVFETTPFLEMLEK